MRLFLLKWVSLTGLISLVAGSLVFGAQDDTVRVQFTKTVPVIDGIGDDECWNNDSIEWQEIDQVWIPWGGTMTADDFTGKYMVCWNKDSNLLYFLAEITDDAFVDGYVLGQNEDTYGGYPDYDILEIFIDENRSKGAHLIDGTGTVWGSYPRGNGENAFAYHLTVKEPLTDGTTVTDLYAIDLGGGLADQPTKYDYVSHIKEFAVSRDGSNFVWELALSVYGDTYAHATPENSRISLVVDKIIGLSMAYCDNDGVDEVKKSRDNFIGSVAVTSEHYNDHWWNATDFGVLKLMDTAAVVANPPTAISDIRGNMQLEVLPTRVAGQMKVNLTSAAVGEVNLEILDMAGRQIIRFTGSKNASVFIKTCDMTAVARGLYMVRVSVGGTTSVQKIVKF